MNIEWMKPGDLIPYPANAKLHPPAQVDHIANSIKVFGWQQPIVVDKNNVVVDDNHARTDENGRLVLFLDAVNERAAYDLWGNRLSLPAGAGKTDAIAWIENFSDNAGTKKPDADEVTTGPLIDFITARSLISPPPRTS